MSVNVPAREERSWCRLMEGFIRNFIICGIFSVMCGIFFPNACDTKSCVFTVYTEHRRSPSADIHVCMQHDQNESEEHRERE